MPNTVPQYGTLTTPPSAPSRTSAAHASAAPRANATGEAASTDGIGSVVKALDVLFHLHSARDALGVTEIARALGQPKSSVHRLLATLCKRRLVERDERGRYRLGIGLVALGLGALEQEPLVLAAREPLADEAARLGETVFLVAARARALVVLAKAEGSGVLRASPRVGSSVPVHATAVGKVYVAWAPGEVTAPKGALEAFTPRTAKTWAELEQEATQIRERGHALSDEEWIEGLAVVAAPILRPRGLLGTVAIAVAAPRLHAMGARALGERAAAVAHAVERRLEGVME
jgi:DNA-binding IclR family transcriptional regulator